MRLVDHEQSEPVSGFCVRLVALRGLRHVPPVLLERPRRRGCDEPRLLQRQESAVKNDEAFFLQSPDEIEIAAEQRIPT